MSDAKIFLILLVFLTFCYLGGLRGAVSTRKKKYILDLDWKRGRWRKSVIPADLPKKVIMHLQDLLDRDGKELLSLPFEVVSQRYLENVGTD